jgi:hypothetical protein
MKVWSFTKNMDENLSSQAQTLQNPPPQLFAPVPIRLCDTQLSVASPACWDQYFAMMYFMHTLTPTPSASQYPEDHSRMLGSLPETSPLLPNRPDSVLVQSVQFEVGDVAALNPSKRCPVCSQSFVSAKGMKQHLGKVHPSTAKAVPCDLCSKPFKDKYALHFHVRQVHEKCTRVPCTVCGKLLYNKYILKKHLKDQHFVI